jgi:membrane associated rhomboid family serine protease
MMYTERRIYKSLPYLTYCLAIVQVAIYFYLTYESTANYLNQSISKSFDLHYNMNMQELIRWGGNFYLKTTQGEWWRLFTAPFLHLNLVHLWTNIFAFVCLSYHLERLMGSMNVLILFMGSAVLSGLCSILYYDLHIVIGASGGIYGLMGGGITFLLLTQGKRLQDVRRKLFLLILFFTYTLCLGFYSINTDHISHLSGLFIGIILGIPLTYTVIYKETYLSFLVQIPAWRGLSICLIIGCTALGLRYFPEPSSLSRFIKWFEQQEKHISALPLDTLSYKEQRWLWLDQIDPIFHRAEEDLATLAHYVTLVNGQDRIVHYLTAMVQSDRQYFAQLYLSTQPMSSMRIAFAHYQKWLKQVYKDALHQPSSSRYFAHDIKLETTQAHIQLMLRADLWSQYPQAMITFALHALSLLYKKHDHLSREDLLRLKLMQQSIHLSMQRHPQQLLSLSFEDSMILSISLLILSYQNDPQEFLYEVLQYPIKFESLFLTTLEP